MENRKVRGSSMALLWLCATFAGLLYAGVCGSFSVQLAYAGESVTAYSELQTGDSREMPIVDSSGEGAEGAGVVKSGLLFENDILTSYDSDGNLKSLSGWQFFEGTWYWFENSAVASRNKWIRDNGSWYWLSDNGRMATGTFATSDGALWHATSSGALLVGPGWVWDGAWYLVEGTGRLDIGWQWRGGSWYWLDSESGVMATGWFRDASDTWYLTDGSGAMLTGWQWRGAWYYLSSSGAMKTGWLWDGAWYWLDSVSGAMRVGWIQDAGNGWWLMSSSGKLASNSWAKGSDGLWRWAGSDGSMQTGWLWDGAWYWLDRATGVMTVGLIDDNGTWYWAAADGRMASSCWVLDNANTWHYVGPSGAMRSGWLDNNGARYYLDPATPQYPMVTGLTDIGGFCYYFADSGVLVRKSWVPAGEGGSFLLAGSDGKLCETVVKAADGTVYDASGAPLAGAVEAADGMLYVDPATGMLATGWFAEEDGSWRYYYPATGLMATGWLNIDGTWYLLDDVGTMLTGWQRVDGTWYYLEPSSGAMRTGWLKDNGAWYYLRDGGAMATGWVSVGGKWYYLNASGAMQTGWLWDGGVWYYLLSDGSLFRVGDVVGALNSAGSGGLSTFNTSKQLSQSTYDALRNAISNYENAGKTVGFMMVDLTDGSGIAYNADWRTKCASTIKAPYVVAVNKLWPWELSNSEYDMYWALQTSDDFCYYACANRYGRFPLDAMANDVNARLDWYATGYAFYSPRDLAKLWVGVSDYLINGGQNSTWLQNVLSSNRYITSRDALSWTGSIVYAKSGWLDDSWQIHNEGYLVMRGDHPYIVSIMSNSTLDQAWRMNALANAIDSAHSDLW